MTAKRAASKQETWEESWQRRQREEEERRREHWIGQLFQKLEVLKVLKVMGDAVPVVEIAEYVGRPAYHDREKIAITCRRLHKLGMVERETRKYENVVRWSLTEHGLAFLDRLAADDKAETDA